MEPNKEEIMCVLNILAQEYQDSRCELRFDTPFQLLIATILAAQATDKKVNQVTEYLFSKYSSVEEFLDLSLEELESKIKQINLYKTKARNILSTCKTLKEKYNGEVPIDREALMELAGVGRKTANVVLSYAFGQPAIAVDTHVFRVANRLGLVKKKDVLKTELELEKCIPKDWWSKAHSTLVLHGRRVCDAKKPKCDICKLARYCSYYSSKEKDKL